MSRWKYGIEGCNGRFEDVENAVIRQTVNHEHHECEACETVVPEGYFVIHRAFDEHARAEFVRAYGADFSTIYVREDVKDAVEADADLDSVVETLHGWGAL